MIGAWFLGPSAENAPLQEEMLLHILRDYFYWRRNHYPSDGILIPESHRREHTAWRDDLSQTVNEMLAALKRHFPFYSPRYIAHQLSDQTIPAVLGYFAGMLYNPNNVSPEGAPVTVDWELEVGRDLLRMLGYAAPGDGPEFGWAHLTSGGTVANIEALWIARAVRSFPLAARHALLAVRKGRRVTFPLTVAHPGRRSGSDLAALSDRECLELPPVEAISLLARFTDVVRRELDLPAAEAAPRAWELLRGSGRLIAESGPGAVHEVAPPVILVSGAAHYSIAKAADLLGIGRERVRIVDVDHRFRIDVKALRAEADRCAGRGETILAVVAIAGTTEEGAVDPVHRIAGWRQELEKRGRSFWLHIDAAWAGYIRSIFATPGPARSEEGRIADVRRFVSRRLAIRDGSFRRDLRLEWGDPEVCRAFLAFARADSITIDPHKMGYLQYPSGAVAFRNDGVRHLVAQRAAYIGHHGDPGAVEAADSIGPYILEGSKPGAAAAAALLSHRMIGPDRAGYGQIARASLLATRELFARIETWERACRAVRRTTGYRLLPISVEPPDTNLLCFVVRRNACVALARLNAINEGVYRRFTVTGREGAYTLPFFISRTVFKEPEYPCAALAPLLKRLEVTAEEYRAQGLFVLRCTLMSPYITFATEAGPGPEYLAQFMQALHEAAEASVAEQRSAPEPAQRQAERSGPRAHGG